MPAAQRCRIAYTIGKPSQRKIMFSDLTDSSAGFQNRQDLLLLKIYTLYRSLISVILLLTFFLVVSDKPLVGNVKPVLFTYTIISYCLINLLSLVVIFSRRQPFNQTGLLVYFFIDILAILLLTDANGGISSGLAILLVICIAAAGIILIAQLAYLLTAMAALFLIADTVRLISQQHLQIDSLFPTGILGVVLFATTFLIQTLSDRIRQSQQLAAKSAASAINLQRLNNVIVERMRTGILVIDQQQQITLANQAARELLQLPRKPKQQDLRLPGLLQSQLEQWRQSPQFNTSPFRMSETGPQIQANFSSLKDDKAGDTLIFLEDNRQLTQRAQEMKLASLGRFTASIAHEIRNPLGAISHAAQLLDESEALDDTDRRFADIIQKQCLRMNTIIENILQLSRQQSPKEQRLQLQPWLQDFIQEFSQQGMQNCRIDCQFNEENIDVTFDPEQLHQILVNLFTNGLRYSQQATGQACLQLIAYTSDDIPVLDVIDFGDGVSDEDQQHLFEPFFTTEKQGTGLGLYIAREMCTANQARLNYLKVAGRSCFRISFSHPKRRLLA